MVRWSVVVQRMEDSYNAFMDRHPGLAQCKVLMKKNFLLYYRGWQTTALQLLAPLFFVVFLLVMQKIPVGGKTIPHPPVIPANSIPPCTPFAADYCYTLMFAPGNDSTVYKLMELVAEDTGYTISNWSNPVSGSFVAMESADEIQDWILPNPNITTAVVTFTISNGVYSYVMWYNSTCVDQLSAIGVTCPDYRPQIQRAVDQAIARTDLGNDSIVFEMQTKQFPLVPLQTAVDDVVAAYGVLFFSCGLMFNFVITLYQLVNEKEKKLKMGMRMMGLKPAMFWLSWFVTSLVTTALGTLIMIGGGKLCNFDFFLRTNFAVLFLCFFSFGFSMMMLAFFVSTLLSTTRQAVTVGMLFFIIGAILEMFFSVPFFIGFAYGYRPASTYIRNIFLFYPPFNFAKIVLDITTLSYESDGVEGPGYNWDSIYQIFPYPNGAFTPNTLTSFYLMALDTVIFILLAFICENVVADDSGVPRPWYFLFTNEFWGLPQKLEVNHNHYDQPLKIDEDTDPDVANEDESAFNAPDNSKNYVRILRLGKVYSKGGIFSKKEEFQALKDFSALIEKGKLFCVLGHNGAGKTTTFNILTGLFPPSSGDATVCGHSVINEMEDIRRFMGVCPQHDILWPELTAREHLEIFAELKGIRSKEREKVIDDLLNSVRLFRVGNNPVGTYSGGMKRRLSVAIASIGNPKIIIMDEPTTGMDPLSRKHVWGLIQELKKDRIVLLTTHSMEEAEVLADRIAIMAKGKLRCIGNQLYLKNRYGDGFRVNLQVSISDVARLKALVSKHLPGALLHTETGGSLTYKAAPEELPNLIAFFEYLETKSEELSFIHEWGVSNTTLEEVFFSITKKYYDDMDK